MITKTAEKVIYLIISNLQIPDMFFNWQKNQLKVVFEFKMRL